MYKRRTHGNRDGVPIVTRGEQSLWIGKNGLMKLSSGCFYCLGKKWHEIIRNGYSILEIEEKMG